MGKNILKFLFVCLVIPGLGIGQAEADQHKTAKTEAERQQIISLALDGYALVRKDHGSGGMTGRYGGSFPGMDGAGTYGGCFYGPDRVSRD